MSKTFTIKLWGAGPEPLKQWTRCEIIVVDDSRIEFQCQGQIVAISNNWTSEEE